MLSLTAVKQAFVQSRHTCRQLSTASATSQAETAFRFGQTASLNCKNRAPDTIDHALLNSSNAKSLLVVPTSVTVEPVLQPVYVKLTPSLAPKRDEPPEDSVAVLDPSVFSHPSRRDILHLCVTHYRDSLRQGSANTKTRGEVHGSGIKIRRQKGSGKARLGDGQSPMLRGGGVAFGPRARDFSTKLPRKVIEMGMRVALSVKVKEQRLGVVYSLDWPSGKTKLLASRVDKLDLRKSLFVTGDEQWVGLERASRCIDYVQVTPVAKLNVHDIVKWQTVVLDMKAIEYLERTLGKGLSVANIPLLE